jgi:hypothetical protein
MFIKHLVIPAFTLLVLFGAAGSQQSYSQENNTGSIKITLPDLGDIFGGTYDQNGYDKEGYDRYGYDRYGYDRSGYNKSGYDRYGYDRYGYDREGYDRNGRDRYGNYRQSTTTYDDQYNHHDNGKHKGWYKNKHKHDNDREDNDRDDD